MKPEELAKLMEKMAAELGEHADAVEILASHAIEDGSGWQCIKRGAGNYYARLAMAKEFIDEDRAETMATVVHGRFEGK